MENKIDEILTKATSIESKVIDMWKYQNMNKLYYTPKIEDLFLGYECEAYMWTDGEESKWQPFILDAITKRDSDLSSAYFTSDALEQQKIRTPFLTKEQIEAEDWRVSAGKDFRVTLFRKDKYTLGYNWGNKTMKIATFSEESHTIYKGSCASINEFRKIISYLGI